MDLIIRSAQLRDAKDPVDIGIDNGRVVAIEGTIDDTGDRIIDAGGMLVTESFANPHLHLCKVYTLDRMDEAALAEPLSIGVYAVGRRASLGFSATSTVHSPPSTNSSTSALP